MKIKNVLFLFGFFSAVMFFGCKDTGVDADINIPSSNVSYGKHIRPLMEAHCVGCHNSKDLNGGFDASTYSSLTADPGIVYPGKPENSRIIWRVDPKYGMSVMPPLGSNYKALNSNQVTGLYTWIKEGAKNN
jgi:mono/diheme cytochrome c family protein